MSVKERNAMYAKMVQSMATGFLPGRDVSRMTVNDIVNAVWTAAEPGKAFEEFKSCYNAWRLSQT